MALCRFGWHRATGQW